MLVQRVGGSDEDGRRMVSTSMMIVCCCCCLCVFFFFQAEDGIRDHCVTGVQTCALPISARKRNDRSNKQSQEKKMSNDERPESTVSPQEVGDAAVAFMDGLAAAFGASASSELDVDGIELDRKSVV